MNPAGAVAVNVSEILAWMRARKSPADIEGQRRFGIRPSGEHLGLRMEAVRSLAKAHRRNHVLALELWESGVFEARQLAAHVDDPAQVTIAQMDRWAADFDNWAVCDNACMHLFRKTPLALGRARVWAGREEEYVRRAGFSLIASCAVHLKKEPDATFLSFFPVIRSAASDERNFVRKAVSWALRQVGKRNAACRDAALREASCILEIDTKSARWIARDVLRELGRR